MYSTESSANGATTLSCMNFSGHVGHATIFGWMFAVANSLVVWLGLWLGLGFSVMSGWLMVMHTYLYYFPLPLYRTRLYAPRNDQ